jgi:hypothetical protein
MITMVIKMITINQSELRPGDVILSRGNGCNSKATVLCGGAEFSHVRIVLPLLGKLVCFEAVSHPEVDIVFQERFSGVMAVPIGCQLDTLEQEVVVRTDLSASQITECLKVCRTVYGQPYDWAAIIRHPFLCLLNMMGCSITDSSQVCTEFVGRVLRAANVQWMKDAPFLESGDFISFLALHATHELRTECEPQPLSCCFLHCPHPNPCCGSIRLHDLDSNERAIVLDKVFGCGPTSMSTSISWYKWLLPYSNVL